MLKRIALMLPPDAKPGSRHAIIAQAVDGKGATRDIGSITLTLGG